MSKSRYSLFVDKSIQAMLSAIELYNKPNYTYREESFAILMVNAWELLLKANKLKNNNGNMTSIYVIESKTTKDNKPRKRFTYKTNKSGNFLTVSFSNLIKELTDTNLRLQLETLIEIRDNSIHFINSNGYLDKKLVEIATATLTSYNEMIKIWFNRDLSQYDLYLIPLSLKMPTDFKASELKDEPEECKKLINYIGSQLTKKEENSIHDITISIDIKLNRSNKGIEVRFDKENGTPIYQDSEELFMKKYPMDYNSMLEKLKEKIPTLKQNNNFHDIKRELCTNEELYKERFLDYQKQAGMKKGYYSTNFIKEFKKIYDERI
jgi:hypothetical protein